MAKDKRSFGQITRLPSGRFRARYTDPNGRTTLAVKGKGKGRPVPVLHSAPVTFDSREDAEAWLVDERRLISSGEWVPPAERAAQRRAHLPTLAEYAPQWLDARKVRGRPLAERTKDHYRDLLDRYILPTFGPAALRAITPEAVAHWYDTAMVDRPATQAHAYGLLRAILTTAADPARHGGRPLIPYNPCSITGAGNAGRKRKVDVPTDAEVLTLAATVPERHRLLVLLADGTGLRFGELAELRRSDVKLPAKDAKPGTSAVLKVRRGVVRSRSAGVIAKAPKSEAGIRDAPVPPHLLPGLREHLMKHTAPGKDGLLFPGHNGGHLSPSAFYGKAAKVNGDGTVKRKGWGWYEARRVAGREDLHFHDLRHGALTKAAQNGATLAELQAIGGQSTAVAALRYQQAAADRLADLARKRSEAAGWKPETEGQAQ